MALITAIIIAKNEEEMIENCLKSLSWVDDLLVIDTGSTDNTEYIAKKNKARVIKYLSGSNFSDYRNKALEEAKGVWLFYVDADERISEKLKSEIQNILNLKSPFVNHFSAFAIPRKNNLLGRDMRFGGWWPDYVLRLMKKNALSVWEGELHEQPKIVGNVGKLKNPLYHITHRTISSMIQKTNKWSVIEAKLMYYANHPPMTVSRFLSAMFREFWYRAVRKLGFLDGPVGIIEIVFQIFSRLVSYAKLWELQKENNH